MLRRDRIRLFSLLMLLYAVSALVYADPTMAGVKITNIAVGTYQLDGQSYRVESNRVDVEVRALYGLSIQEDALKSAPLLYSVTAGTQAILPFTITNTGNAPDTYDLSLTKDAGSDLQYGTIATFVDTNGNGLLDQGEAAVSNTGRLGPGEWLQLLVVIDVRSFASAGQHLLFDLVGTSTNDSSKTDADNWRQVSVSTDAALRVSKSSSAAVIDPGASFSYSVTVANTGNQATTVLSFANIDLDGTPNSFEAASGMLIVDPIPAGLSVTGVPATDFPLPRQAGATPLYGYSNGFWSSVGNIAAWGGTAALQSVGWLLPGTLDRGQSAAFTWNAVADAAQDSGDIQNQAEVRWGNTTGSHSSFTNTVVVRVNAAPSVAIGPRGDPLGTGTGSYLSPSLDSGPYTLSYTGNVSTANYVSGSSSNATRVVFWNTVKNTGGTTDSYELWHEWADNPIQGSAVRFYASDGLTPLTTRAISSATTRPLAPGDAFTFLVEVTIPLGTPADSLSHDLRVGATSRADQSVSARTTDRMLFTSATWLPFLKTSSPTPDVVPGKAIHYTITFGNAGSVDAVNASIFDILPASLQSPTGMTNGSVSGSVGGLPVSIPVNVEFSANDPVGSCGRLVWIFPNIPAGFVGSVSYDAVLDPLAADGAVTENQATITAQGMPAAVSNTTTNMAMRPNRLIVEKTSDKAAAGKGTLVRYSVKVKNVSTTAAIKGPVGVYDTLPKGFNYVSGSAVLDGTPIADPLHISGTRTLQWADIGQLAPSGQKTLSYSVLIGPTANAGENFNSVYAHGTLASGSGTDSNTSSARLIVYESLAIDSQTIVGRVFFDLNADTVPDDGEPGLPGVRIYLENGTYTVTDSQGKYHFEDIKAGTHVIKVDKSTLPRGIELMPQTRVRGLGDDDSTLVGLIKGELYKANFRVSQKKPEVGQTDLATVAQDLPPETVTLGKAACVGLTYTISPAENQLHEKEVSVRIDKALAGPLGHSYLVVRPSLLSKAKNGETALDAIDIESLHIDGHPPIAVFPFENALWIRLPDAAKTFDTRSFDQNIPKTNVEAFDRGSAILVRYIADNDVEVRHYVLGIDTQNAISVISEALPDSDGVDGLVAVYRLIQPEAGSASYAGDEKDTKALYGLVSPIEGETYWVRDKITAIVRFPTDAEAGLTMNGKKVPEDSVGRKVIDAANKVTQFDYVGIPLSEGKNTLEFVYGKHGEAPVSETVNVYLAGRISSVVTDFNPKILFADGKTEPEIVLKPLDAAGIPMPEGSFITLTMDRGRFVSPDANPQRDGYQARIHNGEARVKISAEFSPVTRELGVIAGNYSRMVKLEFLPFLRDWIVAGYGEGTATYSINKANQYGDVEGDPDGFSASGRLAFFAKGTIFGCYLVTAAYDSNPPPNEDKLFQELQPDKVFPVYGDSSVQKYDAETSDGKFIKIEKNKSYAMYGDYDTNFSETELTRYNRSFTGAKVGLDGCFFGLDGFWSRTNQSMIKDEIRGNGTSGYYYLSRTSIVENSDKISIEVRSADDPSIVLKTTVLSRYSDYWINVTNGRILFNEPVYSSDSAANPIYIVAVYEVEESTGKYDVFGVRPKIKLFRDALEIGGTGILERTAPHDNFLYGADAVLRFGDHVSAKAEAAWSDVFDSETATILNGTAQTVSFKVDYGKDFLAVARYYNADADFRNPNISSFEGAVNEYSLRIQSTPTEDSGVFLDATRKENFKSGDQLLSAGLQGKIRLSNSVRSIIGARYVDLAETTFSQKALLGKAGMSVDLTARLTTIFFFERVFVGDHMPGTQYSSASTLFDRLTSTSANAAPMSTGYLETGADTTLAGYPDRVFLGLEYKVTEGTKVGLGHEWLGNAGSLVGRTVLGVSSELFRNTYAFANYGLEDALDVPRNLASFGLKSKIDLNRNLSMDVGLESLYVIDGTDSGETFVAPSLGFIYLGDLSKHSLRLEYRYGTSDQRGLIEAVTARKVGANWAYMAKDTFALTVFNAGGNEYVHNLSLGLSYRPLYSDRLNLLSKITFTDSKTKDEIRSLKLVGSVEANYQIAPPLTCSGKYTAKLLFDSANSTATGSFLDLYAVRVLYDVFKNVDFGFHFGFMPNWAAQTLDYYAGVEAGYRLVQNLYASVGWNYKGLNDADLVENSYHSIGFFLSLRVKFDEGTFGLGK